MKTCRIICFFRVLEKPKMAHTTRVKIQRKSFVHIYDLCKHVKISVHMWLLFCLILLKKYFIFLVILDENMQNSMAFQSFRISRFHQNGAYDYIALTRWFGRRHRHVLTGPAFKARTRINLLHSKWGHFDKARSKFQFPLCDYVHCPHSSIIWVWGVWT